MRYFEPQSTQNRSSSEIPDIFMDQTNKFTANISKMKILVCSDSEYSISNDMKQQGEISKDSKCDKWWIVDIDNYQLQAHKVVL